ncbi:MAG: hypothetical protein LBP80_03340 [Treponema sp.]|jgi:hypothetical protein|nr:hypothetical protein [Treponema sp.]
MEQLLFHKAGHTVRLYGLFLAGILLASCAEPIIAPVYRVSFPEPPAVWTDALGPPSWELFWVDDRGILQSACYPEGAEPQIELAQERANPLLARPFWPAVVSAGKETDGQIQSGVMKSAGSVFPFDAADGLVRLSWEGGVAAEFYLALAKARLAPENGSDGSSTDKRRPEWFDWPRFISLLESDAIPQEVREDPWLVDWDAAAAKTVESGWDSRRIRAAGRTPLTVTIPADGLWFGTSPFTPAHFRKAGELVELPAWDREIPELLLSPAGYLKYTTSDYVWHEW